MDYPGETVDEHLVFSGAPTWARRAGATWRYDRDGQQYVLSMSTTDIAVEVRWTSQADWGWAFIQAVRRLRERVRETHAES